MRPISASAEFAIVAGVAASCALLFGVSLRWLLPVAIAFAVVAAREMARGKRRP